MKNIILKVLLTAFAVLVLAYILPGVAVTGYLAAIIVAIVIAFLNMFVRPLLIFLTLPATIVTLGLFLLVINAIIILLADKLVDNLQYQVFGQRYFLVFYYQYLGLGYLNC